MSYCSTCKVTHDWSGFTHADWSEFCSCGCRCPVGEKAQETNKECRCSPMAHCRCGNRSAGPIIQGPNYNRGEWYPH